MNTIKNIIFDFGGVLIDWDPIYFFKDYFKDDERMNFFLSNIATSDWNIEQDCGRSLQEGTDTLVAQHPEWEREIRAYYDNWSKMIKGDIPQNVEVLKKLQHTNYHLFGLTNWSAETFPYALKNFDFFQIFEGKIVVSGTEKLIKPNPEIWKILVERYQIKTEESVFIDDNIKNIEIARQLHFKTILINANTDLEAKLKELKIDFPTSKQ